MIDHDLLAGRFVRRRPAAGARSSGSRGTVLWIHGLGESGLGFEAALTDPALRDWAMVVPDLAGYGKSSWSQEPLGLDQHAADLAGWLCELPAEPLVVVGHSMGGVIGTRLCELEPRRIVGFINVEGNITLDDCTYSGPAAALALETFLDRGYADLADQVYRDGAEDGALRTYYPSLRLCDPKSYHRNSSELVALSRDEGLAARMAALAMPTCFIYGNPRGTGEHSRHLLRDAGIEPVSVDDSGHWPFLDQPSKFVQHVVGFLTRVA